MLLFELTGMDSRRIIAGFESQVGREVSRSVLVGDRGEG